MIPSYKVSLSDADLVTGGPAYMLSPSLHLGAISRLWGNQLLQYIEAIPWPLDFHVFFHPRTTPLILLKTSVSHPSDFFCCSVPTLFLLPHPPTPSHSPA